MKTLHIWPENPRACDGEVSLRAVFDGFDSGKKTVEIAVQQSALPRIPSRSDHFALAALFPAMRAFETCVIHGKVSRSLLANLCELNAIWHVWRPETYRLVEWKADQIVEASVSSPVRKGHLFAFSGGVDACATLLRHSDARLGWRKLPIGAAVIVHGFDIPFTDQAGFNRAFDKAKRIASNVGVPHFGVRTNIRDLPTNWEDSFAANVASVLHLFNEVYEGGVFASCEPYRFPILPWGSNPVSNPFQGASNFPVRTDGAELTRLEKIKLITENPVFAGNVRCCWEGKVAGNNCGKCEKCIRTQLELAAFGVDVGENFDQPLAPGMISNIRPRNEFQLIYRAEVLEFAEKNNLSAWWVEELREVVRRGLKPQSVPFQSLRRSQLWKAIRKYVR